MTISNNSLSSYVCVFLLCSVLSLDYHQANISHPHIAPPPNFATFCCLFSLKINKLNPFFSHSLHKTFFLCLLTRVFFFGVLVWFSVFIPTPNHSEHNTYFIHNLLVMVLSMEIYVLLFFLFIIFFCFFFSYFLVRSKREEEGEVFCLCCIVYVIKQSFAENISLFMFILDESTVHVKVYRLQSLV